MTVDHSNRFEAAVPVDGAVRDAHPSLEGERSEAPSQPAEDAIIEQLEPGEARDLLIRLSDENKRLRRELNDAIDAPKPSLPRPPISLIYRVLDLAIYCIVITAIGLIFEKLANLDSLKPILNSTLKIPSAINAFTPDNLGQTYGQSANKMFTVVWTTVISYLETFFDKPSATLFTILFLPYIMIFILTASVFYTPYKLAVMASGFAAWVAFASAVAVTIALYWRWQKRLIRKWRGSNLRFSTLFYSSLMDLFFLGVKVPLAAALLFTSFQFIIEKISLITSAVLTDIIWLAVHLGMLWWVVATITGHSLTEKGLHHVSVLREWLVDKRNRSA